MGGCVFVGYLLVILLIIHRVLSKIVTARSTCYEAPLANPGYFFEPRILKRLRWGLNAHSILQKAYEQYRGRVYRIDRGDIELVVVPVQAIPEFNALPESMLSSREAHSYNLLGHLTEIDVMCKSGLYSSILSKKLTPALPRLTARLQQCLGRGIDDSLKPTAQDWLTIHPLQLMACCIGRAFSALSIGAPLCDNAEHIQLVTEQSKIVFDIVFLLRFVPGILQPILVWALPCKWTLARHMKRFEALVMPEVRRLQELSDLSSESNLLSWAVQCAQTDAERDARTLARLHAATAAGSTHSVSVLVVTVLLDLLVEPDLLEMVREEIRQKHVELAGSWTCAAYGSLLTLDSVLKESGRLQPVTMPVYNRQLLMDYTMADGTTLRKGQIVCVSGSSVQQDSAVFANAQNYEGLRALKQSRKDGKAHLFRKVDHYLFWGAGRFACPGRYLADLEAKIILVKLLIEYDFRFAAGAARPSRTGLHDYGIVSEKTTLLVRRRRGSASIGY